MHNEDFLKGYYQGYTEKEAAWPTLARGAGAAKQVGQTLWKLMGKAKEPVKKTVGYSSAAAFPLYLGYDLTIGQPNLEKAQQEQFEKDQARESEEASKTLALDAQAYAQAEKNKERRHREALDFAEQQNLKFRQDEAEKRKKLLANITATRALTGGGIGGLGGMAAGGALSHLYGTLSGNESLKRDILLALLTGAAGAGAGAYYGNKSSAGKNMNT